MSAPEERRRSIDLSAEEFRDIGHRLIDDIAELLGSYRERPVAPTTTPSQLRELLPGGGLPVHGRDASALVAEVTPRLFEHSTHNGHPRFWGYVTSSAAPLGILAELLAASVNANVGAWELAPLATEIEKQTIAWLAELVGMPTGSGGLLVSGGNMANFVGFVAGRHHQLGESLRAAGLRGTSPVAVYASRATHTWIEKATELLGHGRDAVRWISTDVDDRVDLDDLRARIRADRDAGITPMLVVGNAGTVATGAVDPLRALRELCTDEGLWMHVDGAYGGIAACLPESGGDFEGLGEADSIAIDPHKWLYAPLEAGCALVRRPEALRAAFFHAPDYYHFAERGEEQTNFHELGFQNSRGFRALKVWLALRQVGADGVREQVRGDIAVARAMADALRACRDFEVVTCNLSIVTFRYHPEGVDGDEALNELNRAVLDEVKRSGELFLSNAVVGERFCLRACVVNFRSLAADARELPARVRAAAGRTGPVAS